MSVWGPLLCQTVLTLHVSPWLRCYQIFLGRCPPHLPAHPGRPASGMLSHRCSTRNRRGPPAGRDSRLEPASCSPGLWGSWEAPPWGLSLGPAADVAGRKPPAARLTVSGRPCLLYLPPLPQGSRLGCLEPPWPCLHLWSSLAEKPPECPGEWVPCPIAQVSPTSAHLWLHYVPLLGVQRAELSFL